MDKRSPSPPLQADPLRLDPQQEKPRLPQAGTSLHSLRLARSDLGGELLLLADLARIWRAGLIFRRVRQRTSSAIPLAERRRSRTDLAVGYTTVRVLKTRWATRPGRSAASVPSYLSPSRYWVSQPAGV